MSPERTVEPLDLDYLEGAWHRHDVTRGDVGRLIAELREARGGEWKDRAEQAEYELAWLLGYADDAVVGVADDVTHARLECIREMLAWHHEDWRHARPSPVHRLAAIHALSGKWLSLDAPDLGADLDLIHDLSASDTVGDAGGSEPWTPDSDFASPLPGWTRKP